MANGPVYRMKVFMSKHMIACDEASFLISFREDEKLNFWKWWKLKMHLLSCHICRKYSRQIGEMSHSMKLYREGCSQEPCSHHLSPEAGSLIDKELNRELNAN
jgi:hypothetical protein